MTRLSPILLGVSLALAGGAITAAQDATPTPPKVLQITREWLKPGKSGMAHDKSEAAFVSLMNRAKLDGHYIALNSMSGKSRALYITRYPSFEAWEKDNKTVEKNASLAAEFDRDVMTDGELLDGLDQGVFTYDEELSLHPHPDVSHARYYEITAFHVKPGHVGDFMTLAQMYKAAVEKMGQQRPLGDVRTGLRWRRRHISHAYPSRLANRAGQAPGGQRKVCRSHGRARGNAEV